MKFIRGAQMKKLKYAGLISILLLSIVPFYEGSGRGQFSAAKALVHTGYFTPPERYDQYEDKWQAVTGFDEKGKPRSALSVVEEILASAKKTGNAPQIVKAQIHRVKYLMTIGEKEHPDMLRMLEKEAGQAAFPEKPILQSLLAEAYWNYFSANRYMFYKRTQTVNFKEDDIAAWSLGKIFERIIILYSESILRPDDLAKVPIGLIDEVLVKGNVSRTYRPTLYDFLAHRAIDFFMIDEHQLTRPANDFEIDSPEYFGPAEDFVRFKATGDQASIRYRAVLIFQKLTRLHLAGISSDPGPLADVELKRLRFINEKTIVPEKDFLYVKALQALEKRFAAHSSSALVTYEMARWYKTKGEQWKEGDPADHQWSIKKSVEMARDAIRRFPGSEGALQCRSLTMIDKSLSLLTENVNAPRKPLRMLVKYKNVARLYLRTVRLSDELMEYLGSSSDSSEIKAARLAREKPLHEWDTGLPDDGDLREHAVELIVPGNDRGPCAILAGTDRSFSSTHNAVAYMATTISGLSFVHRVSPTEGVLFYVSSRDSGQPVREAKIMLTERSYDYKLSKYVTRTIGTAVSDASGYARFKLDRERGRYYGSLYVVLQKGNDRLKSEFSAYAYEQRSPAAHQTYFFTDRSIYRPGQLVHFKLILLQLDKGGHYAIWPDQETQVEFLDYNQRKIGQVILHTNRYGTASGSFTAPIGVLTGQMTIRNNSGAATIRVEEYKRPKFETGFNLVKGSYRLGDRITATGYARSYSGAPLSDAQVKYSVVRRVWFPYRWWGWYYRHFNGQETVIKKGETRVGSQGEFAVEFEALPDRRIPRTEQPAFYYEIHADVTDINGETHGAETDIRAGYVSLSIEVSNLPASVDSTKGLTLDIRSSNLSGEPVPASGSISISRIREPERLLRSRLWERPDRFLLSKKEFIKNFPYDIYNDEDDIQKRGTEKKVFSSSFNTAKNKAVFPLPDISEWADGDYLVEIDSRDTYGEKIHYERYFSVYSPRKESYSHKTFLKIIPLTGTAEPGSNARLMVCSFAKDARMFLDIIRKGSIVEKKVLFLDRDKEIVTIPVRESDRGNIHYRWALIKHGRLFTGAGTFYVPWTNKELKVEFSTFRNRIKPGEKEEWRIRISGHRGDMAAAELVASMYDASLNSFYPHYWYFSPYNYFYNYNNFQSNAGFSTVDSHIAATGWNEYPPSYSRYYDILNLFGARFYSRGRDYRYYKSGARRTKDGAGYPESEAASADREDDVTAEKKERGKLAPVPIGEDKKQSIAGVEKSEKGQGEVQVRKNLNETAFFYPHLITNGKGEVIISFTAPEALTRWKILGFAHTVDLKSVLFSNELVTQKELMVAPNMPRFFREGDTIVISSKISNLTDTKLSGKAELFLFDAVSMKPMDREFMNEKNIREFSVAGKGNGAVSFRVKVPESIEAVTWRVVARAGNFSDGEESMLPVLSNRMLVTESMPLPVRGNQKRNFNFTKLLNSEQSKTLSHHRLTLEFTSNPAWYAVQALPYLMEYPHECAEQLFSRFYANSLAGHIVNSSPRVKAVFDRWRNSPALLSNLQKNEELKSVFLQETPWVLDGNSEEESKKRVALFFDLNRMSQELDGALAKLGQMQGANGGWPWFSGLPESWHITQHILTGLAKLRRLGVKAASGDRPATMITKGIAFIDGEMLRHYDYLKRNNYLDRRNISYIIYHYLYARSFFPDTKIGEQYQEALSYWKRQAAKYWPTEAPYAKGLAAIALYRLGEKKTAAEILESLKETAIYGDELGMYWKENVGGYWWWEAPVETQSLLIEAFDEAAGDRKAVNEMRTWLLKSKQVSHWNTTKATTDACYAILMGGSDWLSNERPAEIFLGGTRIDPASMGVATEAGTGYFKIGWSKNEIAPRMGSVTVVNKNSGPAWGALYWQYFEQMDKITPHETPLKVDKKLFLAKFTDKGRLLEPVTENTRLKPGDRLRVRIILKVDRDMDYVHMKDLRAAGVEPENVLSMHRFQDGLYYYESTKDSATHFFIERLPKGTFVFEYPLVANLKGDFSAGITTIQCMYAPEFTSHSEGLRIRIE